MAIFADKPSENIGKRLSYRELGKDTARCLCRGSVYTAMLASWLFCLLVGVAVYSFTRVILSLALLLPLSATAAEVVSLAVLLLLLALFVMLLMPLLLGRLRMAGLVLMGEEPIAAECLYYFTTRGRLLRAWRGGLVMAALVSLPVLCLFFLQQGIWQLYADVFTFYFNELIALLLLLGTELLCLAIAVLLFLAAGVFCTFPALLVGNEGLCVREALWLAIKQGRACKGKVFRFSLAALARLAVCLLLIGVPLLLWFSHHYLLTYLRFSMALCPKEDSQ